MEHHNPNRPSQGQQGQNKPSQGHGQREGQGQGQFGQNRPGHQQGQRHPKQGQSQPQRPNQR